MKTTIVVLGRPARFVYNVTARQLVVIVDGLGAFTGFHLAGFDVDDAPDTRSLCNPNFTGPLDVLFAGIILTQLIQLLEKTT
ncbi:MAG: hypothetical protein AAFV37_00965 [Pseudomonadota bacterium]